MPAPLNDATIKIMKANRSKNTGPEQILRRSLRESGFPGYRLNWKKAVGKPDIAYPGKKVAIFVNGCFWHRCPKCNPPLPKNNADFWQQKFNKNVERDRRNTNELESSGWTVITVWECEIKKDLESVVEKISKILCNRSC